ncbi:Fungal lipase-like domain [Sesbania bispinosa]|nr:Fungal lipase-like domain [Sesbania bispinosa]
MTLSTMRPLHTPPSLISPSTFTTKPKCITLIQSPNSHIVQDKITINLSSSSLSEKVSKRWKEYQGMRNWDGLLDPLDDNLRSEILRYGQFVEAAYKSFDFDPSSPNYGHMQVPKNHTLRTVRFAKHRLQSNQTPTCNLRDPTTSLGRQSTNLGWDTIKLHRIRRQMVRQEIETVLETYGDDDVPLSFTITGHSLGAALATLTAYDIRNVFTTGYRLLRSFPLVDPVWATGASGRGSRRKGLSKWGFHVAGFPSWIQKRVEETQWVYSEVGEELRLSSRDSPYLRGFNVATCHDLNTYLHLVDGFVSSTCPFRSTAKRFLQR